MDYCAECTYLNPNDYKGNCNGLYYCEQRCDYVLGNAPKCGNFCRAYSRSDYQTRDLIYKGEQESNYSSGCFITTVISKILGHDDKGYILTILRNFRKNILQQDSNYKQLLVEYDIIGPMIADALINDPNRVMIANNLYENILKKIVIDLEKGQQKEAIKKYKGMTLGLQVCYGFAEIKVDPAIIQARSITQSGYGRQKVSKR